MPRLWNNEPIGERGATVHIQPLFVSQRGDFVAFVAQTHGKKEGTARIGHHCCHPWHAISITKILAIEGNVVRDFIVFSYLKIIGLRSRDKSNRNRDSFIFTNFKGESRMNSIYWIDKSLFPFLKWVFKVWNFPRVKMSNKWLRMDTKKRT